MLKMENAVLLQPKIKLGEHFILHAFVSAVDTQRSVIFPYNFHKKINLKLPSVSDFSTYWPSEKIFVCVVVADSLISPFLSHLLVSCG